MKFQNMPGKSKKPRFSVEEGSSKYFEESDWEPANWKLALENMREMRKDRNAPVDTMGCNKCVIDDDPPEVKRFHCLISLMLSSQTRDQSTFAAMNNLRKYGLSVESMCEIDVGVLSDLIKSVGFRNVKAKYIKETSKILLRDYNGDIPKDVESLEKLPGIGPKMAHLCMQSAWNVVSGIGVDTHVHRISNRLGWVRTPSKNAEDTRRKLESWLPLNLWKEVNILMVGFGQQICKSSPDCTSCLNQSFCPYNISKEMF